MGRVANWESRLADCLAKFEAKTFEWGKSDCLHFATECEIAIYGKSEFDHLREQYAYSSKIESGRRLIALGYETLFDFVSSIKKQKPVQFIQRGDWLGSMQDGQAIGVFDGKYAVYISSEGLKRFKVSESKCAWGV
jgi:hypothetical protein